MTQVMEVPTAAVEDESVPVVHLRPENRLIFWARWLLHIESQKVAAMFLFLVVMAVATAATIAYHYFS